LEAAVQPTVERCRGPLRVALREAGLAPEEITRVLLVGGPTMMPIVRRTIMEEFRPNAAVVEELAALATGGWPVHPMEAVARGAVLGVAGKIAPHGYGLRMFGEYHELLPRRQRYPSRSSIGFQYWGTERTIDFDLLRQAVNPETLREEYTLLGTFQFDCVAEDGILLFEMGWEYTDNGVLHFEVRQAGGASMPLYDVSRLDGHKIARPARPAPRDAQPPATVRRDPWSAAELQHAAGFGRRILDCARERMEQAGPQQRLRLTELCDRLEKWLLDEFADANHRTPHVRDLGRAILNVLYVGRLIDASELAALRREL
jgi:molecular chaperone DnaK